MPYFFLCLLCYLLSGCSGFEKTEQRSIRHVNAHAEKILRFDHEHYYSFDLPEKKTRDPYPWEMEDK